MQKTRKLFFSLAFILLIPFASNASADEGSIQQDCLTPLEHQLYAKIREADLLLSPWPRFQPSEVPVAFRTADLSRVFFMNISHSQLEQARISFSNCSDEPSLLATKASKDFPKIKNTIYEYVYPGDQEHESVSTLATILKKPALIIALAPTPAFPEQLAENLGRTLIHEMFHMSFQYSGGFRLAPIQSSEFYRNFRMNYLYSDRVQLNQFPRPDFYGKCAKDANWLRLHTEEEKILKDIRDQWNTLSETELSTRVRKLIPIRSAYLSLSNRTECVDPQIFWERVEGSAHYIDLVTGIQIGSFSKFPAFDWADGTDSQSYYFNGGTYELILARLFPHSGWEYRVDLGEDPFTVLQSLHF